MPDSAEGVAATRRTGNVAALAAAVSLLLSSSPSPAAPVSVGTASVAREGDGEVVSAEDLDKVEALWQASRP